MSASDLIAIVIASSYALVAYGLWRVRTAFLTVNTLGWLLFPILSIWIVFYLLIPFVDEHTEPWRFVLVWGSRTAHFLAIVLMFLVVKIGENILIAIRKPNPDATD
jgi:hypothetical protein